MDGTNSDNSQRAEHANLPGVKPRRRGKVRLVFWLAAATSLVVAGGLSAAWLLRGPSLETTHEAVPSAPTAAQEREPTGAEPAPPSAPPRLLFHLEAPLPATAEALIDEVTGVIGALVEAFPQNPDCLELRARVEAWLGNSRQAVALWKQCLQLAPNYAHAYAGMADVAARRGDDQQAATLARKAIEIDPGYQQARITAAKALLRLAKPEEAIAVLDNELLTDSAELFSLRGQAHLQLEQLEKAVENYRAAIRIDPRRAEALYGLFLACTQLDQTDQAAEYLKAYRELRLAQPSRGMLRETDRMDLNAMFAPAALFYIYAGRICLAHGRQADAEQLWRRAEAFAPSDKECRRQLVEVYRAANKPEEAIGQLEALAKLEPENPAIWIRIGEAHAELGRLAATEKAFHQACQAAPDRPEGFVALAVYYVKTNQHLGEAVTLAQKAVSLAPTAANYALLAAARQRNGDRAGAEVAIGHAVELDPQNPKYQKMQQVIQSASP